MYYLYIALLSHSGGSRCCSGSRSCCGHCSCFCSCADSCFCSVLFFLHPPNSKHALKTVMISGGVPAKCFCWLNGGNDKSDRRGFGGFHLLDYKGVYESTIWASEGFGKWDFKGSFEFFFTCSRRARKAETSGCRPRVLVFGGGGFRSSVRHSEFACC